MPVLRFATARDVFEAFPSAYEDIATPPSGQPPLVFLRELALSAAAEDAIPFCAYALPRREAVWWACQCVRMLIESPAKSGETALKAAEDWAREPAEPARQRALEIGLRASGRLASTWVALAAAWSGGPMLPGEQGGPAAPRELAARAAFTAIRIALGGKPDRAKWILKCAEKGARIAEG